MIHPKKTTTATATTNASTARNFFSNLDRIGALDLVKKSSKSELSSRFFGRLKISEDLEQKLSGSIFFKKMTFWRSYDFLIRVGRCVVKSYCPKCPYFGGDFLVEGVKDSICVFDLDLAPKMTSTIWCCDLVMI